MKLTIGALLALLLLLMAAAYAQGPETFRLGLKTSGGQLLRFLPILIIAVLVSGFAEVLLPKQLVEQWLSDSAGWRGMGIAWVAGVLTPGGSIIGLPMIAALHKAGVGVSVLMTYATSFATLTFLRMPLEVGFIGWRLTLLRIAVSLLLPFIAGGLTRLLLPLLGDLGGPAG